MSEEPQNSMEGRVRRRASPAGVRTRPARVEPEPPPTKRYELGKTRVAVVYYLCRNHNLEHPHFMEVPLTSPQGLHLRGDTSGFVWHDLSEGDLLLPAQGTEYVLKGSELQFDQSTISSLNNVSDHQQNSSASNAKVQLAKPTRSNPEWPPTPPSPTPAVPAIIETVSPSPPAAVVSTKEKAAPQAALLLLPLASTIGYDEQCRVAHSGSSTDSSPKISTPSSGATSPGINNPAAAHDAATQTDGNARRDKAKLQNCQNTARVTPERPEIVDESHSKGRPAGGYHCSRSGTLQSLIRAEATSRRGLLEEDDERSVITGSVSGRLKPANLLGRLMACGPHNPGFDLVQTSWKPRFTRLKSPSSPELSPLGAPKPRNTSASTVGASETENSTGSLPGGVAGKLRRSSSSSTSHGHQDGFCEEARSSEGDSVDLSRSTSKRTSDPSVVGKYTLSEGSVIRDQGGRKECFRSSGVIH